MDNALALGQKGSSWDWIWHRALPGNQTPLQQVEVLYGSKSQSGRQGPVPAADTRRASLQIHLVLPGLGTDRAGMNLQLCHLDLIFTLPRTRFSFSKRGQV